MCLNQFTNLLSALLFISVISSCCSLPLVNCGPKIASVKVNPETIEIHCGDDLRTLSFKGWNYLLKSNRNVVYLDVSSDGYDLNQYDLKLYFLNQYDTTFLKPSIEEYSSKEQVSRYEVSRDSIFVKISLHLEVRPNAAGCQLNRNNIQLLIDSL